MNGWGITLSFPWLKADFSLKIIRIQQISQVKWLNTIYQKGMDYDQVV